MLIITNRHSKEDLSLWNDYELIDKMNCDKKLESRENEALEYIFQFYTGGEYSSISWGKDSTVIAHLIYRSQLNIPLVHLRCFPNHNIYCDNVRDTFLKEYKLKYEEIIVNYGNIHSQNLPEFIQDKETDKLFFNGFKIAAEKYGDNHITGIRSQESSARKLRSLKYGAISSHSVAPIHNWTTQNVFSYLYKYNLPVHPNYAMLGDGRWDRDKIRVSELADIHGNGFGRTEWEKEYYPEEMKRIGRY